MDTQTLQQDLVELVVLLQGLNPQHLATVAQFLRHRPEDLLLGQLGELLRSATSSQVDRLVSLATSTNAQPPPGVPKGNQPKGEQGNDGDNEQEDSEQDMEAIDKLPKEMVTSFGLLVQIYQLYQLLNRLSILQLMKIFEFVPSGPQVQQLQLLQQLQQLLGQLLPETLASLHQELASAEAGREQTVLSQLLQLRKEHFHLYQPLRMLLQLDLDDLLALQDALPRLQPVQMLQLLALLQLQPFDVLELKRILHAARLGPSAGHQDPALLDDFGGLLPPPTSASPAVSIPPTPTATTATASVTTPGGLPGLPQGQVPLAVPLPRPTPAPPVPHAPRARPLLRIVEQPPEKSVYKRNLKPNPTLQLVEEELGMESNLYIAPVLIRCDTLEEKNKLLTGNKPVKVAPGRVVSFRRLKIMATSHQQGESLFAIRFELRRYHGNEYEILDYVQSNPVCVLSHSTQLRPVSSMTPSVTEVIPYSGSTAGGTRVAVLGTNFVDSPSARVRFDNIDVMPIFHGPRTLICTTPPHHSGIVSVRVSNDSKLWSPTAASFTYEEKGSGVAQTNAASVRPAFEFEGLGAGDVAQAAWQGNADMLRDSLDGASGDEGLDAPDARGYTALHIAAAGGDGHVVELLLQHGADADKRDSRGNAALHWAAGFGHAEIVESLLDSGADANATNLGLETPLHWAAATGHAEICELLLLGGAHCFASAIHGDTPLHRAAAVDETAAVLTLLQYGAPTNVQDDDGDTPLHYALREGSNAAFAALLEHGADPTLPNCDFESPLHFAAAFAGVDLVRGLLNAGADVGAADVTKATAVHWAAELGSGDVLEALLEAGAQGGLKDTFGHTPLVYASDCGVEAAIAPLLCSAACDMDALLSQYLDLDTASFVADDGDEEGEADDDGFGLAAMGRDAAAIELLTLGLDAVSLLGEHEQAALQKQDRAALRSIGDSCHGRASLASQLAAAATGGGATGAAFRVGAAAPRALPDGLMQLASSPASSFAAFAPASVLSESPAGSRGFFPALGFSSFGHAAAAF